MTRHDKVYYGLTYTWQVTVSPQNSASDEQEVLEVEHGGDGVGEEAQKVWEGNVRDAVCCKVLPTVRIGIDT